jgi:hypothetical protein
MSTLFLCTLRTQFFVGAEWAHLFVVFFWESNVRFVLLPLT